MKDGNLGVNDLDRHEMWAGRKASTILRRMRNLN